MNKKWFYLSVLLFHITLTAIAANAETLSDFIKQGTFNGYLRDYYFSRSYTSSDAPTNQAANDVGGMLKYVSPNFLGGFSVGGTFWAASDIFGLEDYSHDNKRVDATLAGIQPIYALGEAYVQWKNNEILLRAGNQRMDTPWMGDSDSRMIPATYQGVLADFNPVKGLDIIAAREYRWKPRTSSTFSATNLYNYNNMSSLDIDGYGGQSSSDNNYGGQPSKTVGYQSNDGTVCAGLRYRTDGFKVEEWYYDFYNMTDAAYFNGSYTYDINEKAGLLFGAQYMYEHSGSDNLLASEVNNNTYGVMSTVNLNHNTISLSYNKIPAHSDSFKNGELVSPYTVGYTTDPLYTSSMIGGLIEKGTGNAWKISGTCYLLDDQLRMMGSYAQYHTEPNFPDTNETDIDLTYNFSGSLKGLSLRNRFGAAHGMNGTYGSTNYGTFYYNRVMAQYDF